MVVRVGESTEFGFLSLASRSPRLTAGLADLLLASWGSVCSRQQGQDNQSMYLPHKELPASPCE